MEGKINDADISGALRVLSSEDSIATPSTEVLDVLRSKHPVEMPDAVYPDPPDWSALPPDVTVEEVLAAVQSFPNGSAGGIDGLRPQHLKDMLNQSIGAAHSSLAEALAKLMTVMIHGKAPEGICDIFYGASLTALKKKDGGIRPIAVGNTLRRLASKIVSKRVGRSMEQLVRPEQVGCGTKGGAEAAVHAARCFVEEVQLESRVLLKLDFKNAFNTIHRHVLLQLVRDSLPEYFPFLWQTYRFPSKLLYGEHILESARGVQQGDPLGPMLFCLVIRELTKSLVSPFNVWYLDDGTVGGDIDSVLLDLETVVSEGSKLGLELNTTKCEMFVFDGEAAERNLVRERARASCAGLLFPSETELSLLGAPLLKEGLLPAVQEKTSNLAVLQSRLNLLCAHQALFLLKNCLGLPKLLYVLRCSPAWKVPEALKEFDESIRVSLSAITNTELDEKTWRQATLPVSLGGLGIRRTEEIALSAYLASIHSVQQLVSTIFPDSDLDSAVEESLLRWSSTNDIQPPTPEIRSQQRAWDCPMTKGIYDGLLRVADLNDKARLLACSAKNSGAWLHALPAAPLGNLLDDNALRIAVGLRLGSRLCLRHSCRCGATVDEFGHHGLSCQRSVGRVSRHDALNETIRRALVSANVPARLEPKGMLEADRRRPDGMSLVPWKHGKALTWDVTVVDTVALTHVVDSAGRAGSAAENAEKKKTEKYSDLGSQYLFYPVGLETFGTWGPSATDLLEAVGRKMAEQSGESRSVQFFKQRISIDIQRGNCYCVLGTVKESRGLDEIFYILDSKKGKSSAF